MKKHRKHRRRRKAKGREIKRGIPVNTNKKLFLTGWYSKRNPGWERGKIRRWDKTNEAERQAAAIRRLT